jgi:hypothetical protein
VGTVLQSRYFHQFGILNLLIGYYLVSAICYLEFSLTDILSVFFSKVYLILISYPSHTLVLEAPTAKMADVPPGTDQTTMRKQAVLAIPYFPPRSAITETRRAKTKIIRSRNSLRYDFITIQLYCIFRQERLVICLLYAC